MSPDAALGIRMASAIVATLISFVAVPFLVNRGSLHGHKLGTIIAIACGILFTASGFLNIVFPKRIIGIVHALPMLCISGYFLYASVPFLLDHPGMQDNAAAGAIALADLLGAMLGAVTAACGLGVVYLVFTGETKLG